MKIVVTGAHFTPAQAVIEELLENYPDVKITYIGRKTTIEGDSTPSVESRVLPKLGVKFRSLTAGRIRRFISIGTFTSLFKIPIGFVQSFIYLLEEKPDVVLSFGGYVGVPTVINAWFLSVPIIVHEQTLISGLANRISNIFADKIAISFDKQSLPDAVEDYSYNKEKVILTGNPFRKELLKTVKKPSKELSNLLNNNKKPIIYITGGNQGSHIINEVIKDCLDVLTKNYLVIHQTGDSKFNDFDALENIREGLENPKNYFVKKWFDVEDVSLIFQKTDLAVSRAGANTLVELAYFGVPTIVVPLPYLYKDEQNINAKFFQKLGLVQILSEDKLSKDSLLELIEKIIKNNDSFKKQAAGSKSVVIVDAAKRVAQATYLLGVKSV